jgi:hypothetical protein
MHMRTHKTALWMSLLSLVGLVLLMLLTNPLDKAIYAVGFFALALVFMISFGHLIVGIQLARVSLKNRYRIITVSLLILILLMFRSTQSLDWQDAVILILISFGLVFYISRRS